MCAECGDALLAWARVRFFAARIDLSGWKLKKKKKAQYTRNVNG